MRLLLSIRIFLVVINLRRKPVSNLSLRSTSKAPKVSHTNYVIWVFVLDEIIVLKVLEGANTNTFYTHTHNELHLTHYPGRGAGTLLYVQHLFGQISDTSW